MAVTLEDLEIEQVVKGFQQLCSQYTRSTENVRTFSGDWGSGVNKVPAKLRNEAGRIVSFLQNKIKQGLFCKQGQCLMIYNFQVLSYNAEFYLLEMLIIPKESSEKLHLLKGNSSLQLIVDIKGNIVNNSYALEMMELLDEDEALKDPPECFGNFYAYSAPQLGIPAKGSPITLSFTALLNAPKQFDIPSPITPSSPLPFSMVESPPSSFMPSFLDCSA